MCSYYIVATTALLPQY